MYRPLRNKVVIFIVILALCMGLLAAKIISPRLCIITATKYMNERYPEKCFKYDFVEYSSAHGEYFVYFTDKDGVRVAIMTSVFQVDYDPLSPKS